MVIQKIYKSRTSLVSLMSVSIALSSTLTVIPYAVAKQTGKAEPVIILSQLQPFGASIMPPISAVKPKAALSQKKTRSTPAGKRKIAPTDHFRIGLALKAKGNSNKALIEFLKATQKNPRQINAFYEQALIFRQQGYLKLADSSLEQALRIAKSGSRSSKKPSFSVNDINRIRLLLATVRLEQGDVGSAAEQLGRSLGISLTVAPNNAESSADSSENNSSDTNSPTTILQSLHPQIEEHKQRTSTKQTPASEPDEPKSIEKTPAAHVPESQPKENADDATVSDLIKEGLAGLKEHLFNPLSILGIPRIAQESDKSSKTKKKEKRGRRILWRDDKKKVETTKAVKAEKEEKRKRRSWIERKLALTPDADVKPADMSVPEETKKDESGNLACINPEPSNQQITIAEQPEEKESEREAVPSSKSAALTFTKEESTVEPSNSSANADNKEEEEEVTGAETDTFSLSMPPALSKRISLVAALLSAFNHETDKTSTVKKEPEKPVDPIDARLKYLAEHGTSSLKEGEAFMFSEESGEATLFMSNGEVIRRTIALARGHEEVAQLRRPDILIPEELIYNLALMAKILPKQEEPKETVGEPKETAPTLKIPAILLKSDSKPHSFSDWLRDVLNL